MLSAWIFCKGLLDHDLITAAVVTQLNLVEQVLANGTRAGHTKKLSLQQVAPLFKIARGGHFIAWKVRAWCRCLWLGVLMSSLMIVARWFFRLVQISVEVADFKIAPLRWRSLGWLLVLNYIGRSDNYFGRIIDVRKWTHIFLILVLLCLLLL